MIQIHYCGDCDHSHKFQIVHSMDRHTGEEMTAHSHSAVNSHMESDFLNIFSGQTDHSSSFRVFSLLGSQNVGFQRVALQKAIGQCRM
jgi:hypothetical protein